MTTPQRPVHAVLFDLDGTLADTAPDLAYALNTLLHEESQHVLPYATIRPHVSHGATALVRLGFNLEPEHEQFPRLRQRLLDIYGANIARETQLFPGMDIVLRELEQRGIKWGIVTNKPAAYTEPLLTQLALRQRAACVISGDTTTNRKPHPEPMLLACRQSGAPAEACIYVGDAQRDVEAGRRAGMRTLVALFGYLGRDDYPDTWGADGLIRAPEEILEWL